MYPLNPWVDEYLPANRLSYRVKTATTGQLWPTARSISPNFMIYVEQPGIKAEQIQLYARQMTDLLNARLTQLDATEKSLPLNNLKEMGDDIDLLIYGEPEELPIKTWLFGPPACRIAAELPASLLVVRQPCWPLRRILLITRGLEMDDIAVTWLLRLAQPSGAAITVLAMQPCLSWFDSRALYGRGLADWQESDTPLGRQLRRIATQLDGAGLEQRLRLRFRPRSPEQQIWEEVDNGQPDLIVIAADPDDWWERRLLGELVKPLLSWTDRPVLVAKPC